MPLTTRLVTVLMAALMVITGVYDYARLTRARERQLEEAREETRVFAETLALAVSRNVRWGRTSAELEDLLGDILARPGLRGVAIFDPDGQPVAVTVAPGAERPQADAAVREALASRKAVSLRPALGSDELLRYVQPVRWPGGRTGALEVRQSLAGLGRVSWREMQADLPLRGVVLIAFVLLIAAVTRWSIARPIRLLIQGARAVGEGDLGRRIDVNRRDELGELAAEFNRMAGALQTARQALVQQAEERLRLEQDVHQAQKLAAVGQLAAEVAHEIGTPLNVISGRAELLERAVPRGHPDRRHLDLILAQTERIGTAVRTLLEHVRPRRPELRPLELAPILGQAADLLLSQCRRLGVRIRLDLPVGLPEILGDAAHLQQLFLNLLLNALDVSPRGGAVRVTTGEPPVLPEEGRAATSRGEIDAPCLAVHVIDQGEGIPPDRLPHVFQPFFSTKGPNRGTGLGLPIAEEIVRAHRGKIDVLSIPGRGSEVIVHLPLATTRDPLVRARAPGPHAAPTSQT